MVPLYLIDNRLDDETLASVLNRMLPSATATYIHVAYLRESGVALLREELTALVQRGGPLRVLAGGDFAQTEPNALQFFRQLGGQCEVKLVSSSGIEGFHSKCYLVYTDEAATLIVGSSNFTRGGLQYNVELNLRVDLPADDDTIVEAQRIFDTLWATTPPLTVDRFDDYVQFWSQIHHAARRLIYRAPALREVSPVPEFLDPVTLQPGDLVHFNGQQGEVMAITKSGDRWNVKLSVQGIGTRTLLSPPTQFKRLVVLGRNVSVVFRP